MTLNCSVTIARTLELGDIVNNGDFSHQSVLDLRTENSNKARPIEEPVLKKLNNQFVDYKQVPLDLDTCEACDRDRLKQAFTQESSDILVVTDKVPQMAALCQLFDVPFKSKVFYIVESDKQNGAKQSKAKTLPSTEAMPLEAATN